ncbi:hypothetical protein MT881_002510, partial [Enterococcus faecium]|nr:hypothetical protein [Enterococcus faecium]
TNYGHFKLGYWASYGFVLEGTAGQTGVTYATKDAVSRAVEVVDAQGNVVQSINAKGMEGSVKGNFDRYQVTLSSTKNLGLLPNGNYQLQVRVKTKDQGEFVVPISKENKSRSYIDDMDQLTGKTINGKEISFTNTDGQLGIKVKGEEQKDEAIYKSASWAAYGLVINGTAKKANEMYPTKDSVTKELEVMDSKGKMIQSIKASNVSNTKGTYDGYQAIISSKKVLAKLAEGTYSLKMKITPKVGQSIELPIQVPKGTSLAGITAKKVGTKTFKLQAQNNQLVLSAKGEEQKDNSKFKSASWASYGLVVNGVAEKANETYPTKDSVTKELEVMDSEGKVVTQIKATNTTYTKGTYNGYQAIISSSKVLAGLSSGMYSLKIKVTPKGGKATEMPIQVPVGTNLAGIAAKKVGTNTIQLQAKNNQLVLSAKGEEQKDESSYKSAYWASYGLVLNGTAKKANEVYPTKDSVMKELEVVDNKGKVIQSIKASNVSNTKGTYDGYQVIISSKKVLTKLAEGTYVLKIKITPKNGKATEMPIQILAGSNPTSVATKKVGANTIALQAQNKQLVLSAKK